MPSTRYQSTKDYEFMAINKQDGEKSVVQVKHQKEELKGKIYEKLSKTYIVHLACSVGVNIEGQIMIE
jgi:hypothetical protein